MSIETQRVSNFQPSHLFSFMLIPKPPDASLSHGKSYLSHISSTHNTKYNTLLKKEQTTLLGEFSEYKLTKETGFCLFNKAKINDCTHTFKTIETKICLSCLLNYWTLTSLLQKVE